MLSPAAPAGVRSLVIEVGLVGHEGCRDFISVCERSFAGLRGHFGMLAEGGALDRDYTVWFEEHRATPELLVRQRERSAAHPGPLMSIVIPSRDHADLLEACASSILQKTEYSNFEIVVVENGSENPRPSSSTGACRRTAACAWSRGRRTCSLRTRQPSMASITRCSRISAATTSALPWATTTEITASLRVRLLREQSNTISKRPAFFSIPDPAANSNFNPDSDWWKLVAGLCADRTL